MFGNNLFNSLSGASRTSSFLSLSKILGGANKTLNFVNKALPLYYQIKPMMGNAKTMLNMYTAMGNNNEQQKQNKQDEIKIIKDTINKTKEKYKNNSLTFFQ